MAQPRHGGLFSIATSEPGVGAMGQAQVQEACHTPKTSGGLAWQNCQTRSQIVRALADGDFALSWIMGAG